ncbi:MAG: hypothetical protein COS99_07115 [Candidatus Omnitrophica bacterium CG07_land_8_20_14_0_80_42_15]|uniref:Glycosyltransferase 2-like domain-containing protein n=1 Tax=Candidatus Aquitaenariimonas noxiae TaxID=1974741 RepID=A0A2J0KTI5_9BACT|nr:MAG: hypothetical protein COS99_07115 [Candidatus Omnitrophica bacterium CG07_land_8_20_14_0_80_42_15]
MNPKKIKNILIINPFGIGDVLFSTPLVKALREHYPGGFIGYVCNRRTEPLLAANPDIDKVFVYEKDEFRKLWAKSKWKWLKGFIKLLKQIKKNRFNVLIDLSLGHQYSSISFLLGVRQRIGFNYKNRGRFLTHKIDIEGYDSKHIVDYYLSLLQFLDIETPKVAKLQFVTQLSDKKWAKDFIAAHGVDKKDLIIGVIPGGGESWGEKAVYKHWGEQNFTKIIDKLSSELSAKIIVFGGPQESAKCKRIVSACKSAPINACGGASLGGFAALLRFCDLVIANDGGPLHVAVSQGAATVSIFGPVDEAVYGPHPPSKDNIVVKKNVDCRPCYRKFKIPECSNRICLQDIAVEDVFKIAKQIIARKTFADKEKRFLELKIPVTVVVLTKNEESNIADCLDSVTWADEIILVDDMSADKTCDVASKYTNKIFKRKMDVEGSHRNWAYSQARNKWVLSLDADEMVSDGLRTEIERLMKGPIRFSAFSIPLRNFIGKYWVRHGGWYPAGKVRLFNKDKFRYEEVGVHPRVFIDGECGHLTKDIIHKGYPNLAHFLDSLNRQTTLEAQKWVDDKRKMSFGIGLRKAHDRFFKAYVLKKGYKDGFIGFMVAFFAYLYQIMSYAKYWELKKQTEEENKNATR